MERPDEYYIPPNYNDGSELAGRSWRNYVEAGGFGLLAYKLISITPLVINVKIVVGVIIVGGLVVLCIFGIKGESVTQYLSGYFKFRNNRRKIHMRPVGYKLYRERQQELKDAIKGGEELEREDDESNLSGYEKEQRRKAEIKARHQEIR